MKRFVTHASFTITRQWKHAPARIFAAFADQAQKKKWFGAHSDCTMLERSFDFREGGRETQKGRWANGTVSEFDCIYQDIVPNERIVYSYIMHLNGQKISVSQACIEITPDGTGSKLVLTEYGDYLDGYDDAGKREHGTNWLMDQLEASLE